LIAIVCLVDILLENILRVDNFSALEKIELGVGFHSFVEVLQVFEFYGRQRKEKLRQRDTSYGSSKHSRRKNVDEASHSDTQNASSVNSSASISAWMEIVVVILGLASMWMIFCNGWKRKAKRVDYNTAGTLHHRALKCLVA
jgi:hypothetical protein